MATVVLWQALLGFLGALVFASQKLWTGLCAGDEPPPRQARARAWGQFATSLLAGALFGGSMTDWLTTTGPLHGVAPWPPVAVTLGLFGNALWPGLLKVADEGVRARLRAFLAGPTRENGE